MSSPSTLRQPRRSPCIIFDGLLGNENHVRDEVSGTGFGGAEGQNRTVDTSLFRAVLYQLSYLGTDVEKREAALLQNDR